MAKKTEKPTRMNSILSIAKSAHKKEVGAGGQVWDPYLSHVRSIRFPSLALYSLLGFTGLRDSCTILIDGAPGSHKSSLAIEMFNWGVPYGLGGAIVDCENKAAIDIAFGTLNELTLWLPGHLTMQTATSVEDAQDILSSYVDKCTKMNKGIDRAQQIPMMVLIDPVAGSPAQETLKVVDKQGHGDKGHGGRTEANLWSSYLKVHEAKIVNIPFVSLLVNHVKQRQKQGGGPIAVTENYNPGGVSQNYATTVSLRCQAGKKFRSEAYGGKSYDEIWIKCTKNSRGPTGGSICVRKYWQQLKGGTTKFWWDWGRATADYLAGITANNPIREVCSVTSTTKEKFSCKQLGMKDVSPTLIGDTIMQDKDLLEALTKVMMVRPLAEFDKLTDDELEQLGKIAHDNHMQYLSDAGLSPDFEDVVVENAEEPNNDVTFSDSDDF